MLGCLLVNTTWQNACLLSPTQHVQYVSPFTQYADSQQALATSLTARTQLCRKCGSPLNRLTCANVHIAWLPYYSSKRLSKKLPNAAQGQSITKRGRTAAVANRARNAVVAVRVCVVSKCDHSSAVSEKDISSKLPSVGICMGIVLMTSSSILQCTHDSGTTVEAVHIDLTHKHSHQTSKAHACCLRNTLLRCCSTPCNPAADCQPSKVDT